MLFPSKYKICIELTKIGINSIERWLVPPKPKANEMEISLCEKIRKLKPHKMSRRYIRNNYVFLLWLIGFLAANLALFVTRAVVFRRHHPNATDYLVIARAAGKLHSILWLVISYNPI